MATLRYIKTVAWVLFILLLMYVAELVLSPKPGTLIGSAEVILEAMALYCLTKRCSAVGGNSRLAIILGLFFGALIVADASYIFSFYINSFNQHTPLVSFMTGGFYAFAFLLMALAFITEIRNSFSHILRNPIFFISFILTTLIAVKFTLVPFWFSVAGKPVEVFYVVQGLAIIAAYLAVFVAFVTFLGARDIFWTLLSIGMLTLGLGDWAMRIETIIGYEPHFGFYEYYWAAGVGFLAIAILGQRDSFRPLELFNFNSLLNTYKLGALTTVLLFVALVFMSGATILSLKLVILAFIICVIVAGLISQFLADKHQRFLDITVELVSDQLLLKSSDASILEKSLPIELQESFSTIYKKRIVDIKFKEEKETESRMSKVKHEIASQVAHDIRSPLAALDSMLKSTANLPEEQRIMVRHAVNRIRDIANNLLEKNRQQDKGITSTDSGTHPNLNELPEVRLLSSILDPVVTEKRFQFESKPGITIDFKLTEEAYGLFAKIQPVEFKRIISNLVNNAVEVLDDKGAVDLGLTREDGNILITIADNGKGIPPEILIKLGQRGETHGKAGGSGLGLYHARTTIESWGGNLDITSALGQGTTVTIKLPEAEAPSGFVSVLELPVGMPVVVLDDDTSIHQVWQERFEFARVKESNIEVIHFGEPNKLREWVKGSPEKANKALYLFDYELLNYKETGLSLARKLNLAPKVILVTSRYEEKGIIEESTQLGIRMIPKGLAGFVPIAIKSQPSGPKVAVLIDDDALVHMTWKMAARSAGVKLLTYKNPQDFNAGIETLAKDTPVYIDSDLGTDQKGEDMAKTLHEKGFTDISMATGYGPENFAHLPWLKVEGKEPPWG